jgi:hypothetical protein
MKALKTLLFLLCLSTLYAQPPAEVFTKNKNVKTDDKFEKAYGFFLRRYAKTYKPKSRYTTTQEVINAYNEIMRTKEFSKIVFAKYLGVETPFRMGLYEFHFATVASAQRIEKYLLNKGEDCSHYVAPIFCIFTRVGSSIFFVRHTKDKNEKPIKALAHCLEVFKTNTLKKSDNNK